MSPYISVLLPVYNGGKTLKNAIMSIQNQTFTDWELLILNEFGSDDGSAEIASAFSESDRRIKLLQNAEQLGLAKTLNHGIRVAKGQLIARIDADDIAYPKRFKKQIDFLQKNPSVGICGTWQKHVSSTGCWIHKTPRDHEILAISLMFSCEMCHSTIMMRKSVLLKNDLFYDSEYEAEDFELWSRAISVTYLSNIPEVLGEYSYGNNISDKKMMLLKKEHGKICAKTMNRILDVDFDQKQQELLNAWENIFLSEVNHRNRKGKLLTFKKMLMDLDDANQRIKMFDSYKFRGVLRARWAWANWNIRIEPRQIATIDGVFSPIHFHKLIRLNQMLKTIHSPKMLLKKIMERLAR